MCNKTEPSKSLDVPGNDAKPSFQYKNPGKSAFAQILAIIMQNWLLIEIGLEMAMPVIVLGALHNNPAAALNLNDDEASWFGSIPDFFHPIGSLTSGLLQEKFGRKGAVMMINIPIFIGWMTLYFAKSVYMLYAVSVIMGLCTGLAEAPLHAYIGEIGEPRMRGTLSTISTSCCIIGVSLMYLLGYLFEWKTVALISSSCSVITFLMMTQLPESPTWLIVRGRLDEARKSLCWLRGWVTADEAEPEFQALVNYTRNSAGLSRQDSTNSTVDDDGPLVRKDGFLTQQFKELMNKKTFRPLRMVFTLFIICFFGYVGGIRPYFINELKKLESPIDPKLFLTMGTGWLFLGAMINVVFLRRFGKRRIAIFSHALGGVAIAGVGIYATFLQGLTQYPLRVWVPIALWTVVNFLNGLSTVTLPWQIVCEVFPPLSRGTATGLSAAWAHLVLSVHVKLYLYVEAWIGFNGIMYLYGICTLLGSTYHYFCLPETEGKSLEQIESYFTKKHDKKEKFSMGKSVQKGDP
nr:PREDICTED: facilitated trehalose transporter Tret1-like [Bemisia tabaci]